MSFFGALFGGGKDNQMYNASNAQISDLLAQNKDTSSFLKTTGGPLISTGAQALSAPMEYYQKLFSGDRTTASNAIGPALDTQKMNQQTMLQNVNKFAPRGGGRTATVASSDTARSAELTKLLQVLKPAAGDAIASLGLNIANLGSGLVGGSSNVNATGLSTLLSQAQTAKQSTLANQQMALKYLTSMAYAAGGA